MDGVNAPHQDTNLATRGVNDVDPVGIFIDGVFRLLPELHGRSYMLGFWTHTLGLQKNTYAYTLFS